MCIKYFLMPLTLTLQLMRWKKWNIFSSSGISLIIASVKQPLKLTPFCLALIFKFMDRINRKETLKFTKFCYYSGTDHLIFQVCADWEQQFLLFLAGEEFIRSVSQHLCLWLCETGSGDQMSQTLSLSPLRCSWSTRSSSLQRWVILGNILVTENGNLWVTYLNGKQYWKYNFLFTFQSKKFSV